MTKKVVFVGEKAVGKKAIAKRFVLDDFNEEYTRTYGFEFFGVSTLHTESHFKLQIWCSAGQKTFRLANPKLHQDTEAVVLVYDITSRASFEALEEERKGIAEKYPDMKFILVGNKTDRKQERAVGVVDGKEYAELHGMPFFETSAKNGNKIKELLKGIVQTIVGDKLDIPVEILPQRTKAVTKLYSYGQFLSKINEKLPSNNDIKAGHDKGKRLAAIFDNGYVPDKEQLEGLLGDASDQGLLFNRNKTGVKLYKFRSWLTGSRNPLLDRLCESHTEELLVKHYNQTFGS